METVTIRDNYLFDHRNDHRYSNRKLTDLGITTRRGWDITSELVQIPQFTQRKENQMFQRYGRRRQLTAEETKANADRKAQRQAATMTCQCCFRKYLANTGTIAHHGYQRPGDGYQTASCMGAKYSPLEVDRDRLGTLINALKAQVDLMLEIRTNIWDEKVGITLEYTAFEVDRRTVKHQFELKVTRENFDEIRNEHQPACIKYGWLDFQTVYEREIQRRDRAIKMVTDDLKNCTEKYQNWTQTAEFEPTTKTWKSK